MVLIMLIDLHAHSTMSDGSYSPEELIDFAIEKGVGVLALCDHDTTAGIERFLSYSADKNIKAVSGVELSATWSKGNCHIVGLGVRNDYQPLEKVLLEFRDSRDNRNANAAGDCDSLDETLGQAMLDLGLSARAHDKILRLARTLADLDGNENITESNVSEAIQHRRLDRQT